MTKHTTFLHKYIVKCKNSKRIFQMEEIFYGGSSNPMKMRSRTYDEKG
jgi:hypothetical protein